MCTRVYAGCSGGVCVCAHVCMLAVVVVCVRAPVCMLAVVLVPWCVCTCVYTGCSGGLCVQVHEPVLKSPLSLIMCS